MSDLHDGMTNYRKDFGPQDVIGRDARVYYNLHTKLWSVQVDGIVRAHTSHVLLRDVTGKVSQAGRRRVLRERRKNVHAFMCGQVIAVGWQASRDVIRGSHWDRIIYNPFNYSTFVHELSEAPFTGAGMAYMDSFRRVFVA